MILRTQKYLEDQIWLGILMDFWVEDIHVRSQKEKYLPAYTDNIVASNNNDINHNSSISM